MPWRSLHGAAVRAVLCRCPGCAVLLRGCANHRRGRNFVEAWPCTSHATVVARFRHIHVADLTTSAPAILTILRGCGVMHFQLFAGPRYTGKTYAELAKKRGDIRRGPNLRIVGGEFSQVTTPSVWFSAVTWCISSHYHSSTTAEVPTVYALIAADGLDHTLQNAPVKQVMRVRQKKAD